MEIAEIGDAGKPRSITSGFTGGLYRGYGIYALREIPSRRISAPSYEKMKTVWAERSREVQIKSRKQPCGSISVLLLAQ
jgi:hypothetical protein